MCESLQAGQPLGQMTRSHEADPRIARRFIIGSDEAHLRKSPRNVDDNANVACTFDYRDIIQLR